MKLQKFFCVFVSKSTGFISNTAKSVAKKLLMAEEDCVVNKKANITSTIGTHNGHFHCDEVFACVLLTQLPEYKHAEIIRTREQSLLDKCTIVVDVGGVYDHSKLRYDHHQRTFNDCMNTLSCGDKKWVTKLSSAGLVYLHYGRWVLSELLPPRLTVDRSTLIDVLYDRLYENFVEEVDAIDNGISVGEGMPRYAITTNISSRVGALNPRWNESSSPEDEMVRFRKAMELIRSEFVDRLLYYVDSWWPARKLVETAILKRAEVDPGGQIVVLQQGGCPWKDHLTSLEEELKVEPSIKFMLYTDQNGSWRVQCVPKHPHSFENRLSLLSEWQGLRDEELSAKSRIPGCIFVHSSGFIGGNKTFEGALEMAKRTLEDAEEKKENGVMPDMHFLN